MRLCDAKTELLATQATKITRKMGIFEEFGGKIGVGIISKEIIKKDIF